MQGGKSSLDQIQTDLIAIEDVPGVTAVSYASSLPLTMINTWDGSLSTRSDATSDTFHQVKLMLVSSGSYKCLQPKMQSGRWFSNEEYVKYDPFSGDNIPPTVVVTQALAQKLWPNANPLGQLLYAGRGAPSRVIGVVNHYLGPTVESLSSAEDLVIFPAVPAYSGLLVVRSSMSVDGAFLKRIQDYLYRKQSDQLITQFGSLSETERAYFQEDRKTIHAIVVLGSALLIITGLGLMGMCTYWIYRRSRTIGIKRALGATRGQIFRYFLIENALVISGGALVGWPGAILLNVWLRTHYELSALSMSAIAVTSVILIFVGQLAVLAAAFKASITPPIRAIAS